MKVVGDACRDALVGIGRWRGGWGEAEGEGGERERC